MDAIEIKMRDKLKDFEYFERFIVETQKYINDSKKMFNKGEVRNDRINWHYYDLYKKQLSLCIAKYSLGISICDVKTEFISFISDVSPTKWWGDTSKVCVKRGKLTDQYMVEPHNKMLSLLSLAFLFKVDSKLFSVFSDIIDHDNISDNLYEFILKAEFLERKPKRPEEYDSKHSVILKVYRSLRLAIEQTDKIEAQKLIKHFLEKDFYHEHSGFYNAHKARFDLYYGYWSFEAAAITCIMDLDDSSYRDNKYYPKDLVDFYRSTSV